MPRLFPYLTSVFALSLLLVGVSTRAENLAYPIPEMVALTQAEEKTLTAKAIKLIELARQGQYAMLRQQLSPTLAAGTTEVYVKQRWEQVTTVTGPVKKILNSRVLPIVDGALVILSVQFANLTDEVIVTFNEQGEIVGINLPKSASIEGIAAQVTEAIDQGNANLIRAYLHPFLKTEIYPQDLEERWGNLEKRYGEFQKVVDTDIKANLEGDQANIVVVTVQFARATQEIFFIFDNNAQITGIDLSVK